MKKILLSVIGWCGVLAILTAYFLNSFSIISAADFVYQALNIIGAAGIVLGSWFKRDYQPMTLNIIWVAIGVISLLKA